MDNTKILVVEDNPHMRSFLRAVLSVSTGGVMEYAEAGNGEEALKVLGAFKPDVIVADWNMAPVDGLELLKRLRQGIKGISPFTSFIMVTSRSKWQWQAEARDAGVTEYLEKPVSVKDLLRGIKNAIENFKPFVRNRDYFGPDRRNGKKPYSGNDRRTSPPVFVSPPTDEEASPS
jgi:CheY-like chemotaxis protein